MSAAVAAPSAQRRFPARVERAATGVLGAGAVLLWAIARTYPNYDSYYHLVWGRELRHGVAPSFEAYAAPTQHPLYVALAAALGLLGENADRALVLVCLLCHAALVLGAYRLGAAVFGRWSGLLGALFVGASASFLLYAARGYVDAPFLALVVWAGVLEVERPAKRGPIAPAALLVLAGLLRPEAWVLAGLAWLAWVPRLGGRGRVALTAALAFAPLAWALADLIVTGDPLHSFHATTELADDLGRTRGLGSVPRSFASFVAATVRPPVAALAVAGLVLGVRVLRWRGMRVPLALFSAGVLTFVGTGALGLSILPRYLTVPSVALCLFAGYALAGFTALSEAHPWRRPWMRAAAAATVLGLVAIAILAPSLSRVSAEVRFIRATHDDLVTTLDDPKVAAARRCGPLTFPTYRLVPDARWHLDAPAGAVGARSARRRARGVAIFVLTPKALRRYGFAAGTSTLVNIPGRGFAPLARHGMLSAFARCP